MPVDKLIFSTDNKIINITDKYDFNNNKIMYVELVNLKAGDGGIGIIVIFILGTCVIIIASVCILSVLNTKPTNKKKKKKITKNK